MASKSKLEELRKAVLGNNQRGREVEVASDGQVVLNPESNQSETESDLKTHRPNPVKMSHHTFGR